MSLIININTATEKAQVSIARDGVLLQSLCNDLQKDHASFLHPAIAEIVKRCGLLFGDIDAFAVSAGPGSYTGLRVGMASAKGLCYALNKPLITLNTLEIMAASALPDLPTADADLPVLLCPMIDARRMEVYTAIYRQDMSLMLSPYAMILDASSFVDPLAEHTIVFFGSGADKWQSHCKHANALFIGVSAKPEVMCQLSAALYKNGRFTELVDSQPIYLKDFHSPLQS